MWRGLRALDRRGLGRKGATSLTVALLLVPLAMAVAVGVDGTHVIIVKSIIANAADATVLALGAQNTASVTPNNQATIESFLTTKGTLFLTANLSNTSGYGAALKATCTSSTCSTIDAETTATIPLYFGSLLGVSSIDISFDNEVSLSQNGYEVALVLDNTGSMFYNQNGTTSGGTPNIKALKDDAQLFLDTVYSTRDPSTDEDSNVITSIVPFITQVNLGSLASKVVSSSDANAIAYDANAIAYSGVATNTATATTGWAGCVRERFGTDGSGQSLALSDASPTGGYWFPQYYWYQYGKESKNGTTLNGVTYNKRYTVGDNDNNWTNTNIHIGGQYFGDTPTGPNAGCPAPVVATSINYKTLSAGLTLMNPWNRGGTIGVSGLAWGYRMLSPNSDFLPTRPKAWNTSNWSKVLVFMTDGINTVQGGSDHFNSEYTSYGRINDGFMGTSKTSQTTALDYLNQQEANLCTTIKSKGVIVYTVYFVYASSSASGNETDVATAKTLLKNCASDQTKFFLATDQDKLKAAFKTIGLQISAMRLSK